MTIMTGFIINSNRLQITDVPKNALVYQCDINGVPDVLTIAVKSSNGNKTLNVAATWQEIV
jgi:hypothetical protein